jgi:hypothetical protein
MTQIRRIVTGHDPHDKAIENGSPARYGARRAIPAMIDAVAFCGALPRRGRAA